jgi:hypothetical protein
MSVAVVNIILAVWRPRLFGRIGHSNGVET